MKQFAQTGCAILLAIACFIYGCGCIDQRTEKQSSIPTDVINPLTDPLQQEEQQRASYKLAITTLLEQDTVANAAGRGDYTAIADHMRRLDLSQCPSDFAVAYVDHLHAWEDAAEIQHVQTLIKSEDIEGQAVVKTLLQKLFGSEANAMDDLQTIQQQLAGAALKASAHIKTTFQEVERIAVAYGAKLPK